MLMISPERRILILLAGMIAGIALVLAGYGSRDLRLAGVMATAALTRACRSGADLVLSFAAPRYDCRVPVFTVSRLRDANFLLLFNGDGSVTVRPSPANSRRTGVTADRIWPVREGSRK